MTSDSLQAGTLAAARARWFAPTIVTAACLIMLAWTWQRCPGPIVDFGRELYVPWRISQGEALYRDLNYFNGPFSPHFNAILFTVFGVSLQTIKLANACITILLALLLYRLIREISDRLTACLGGIAFATVFACGHVVQVANYNFLTPYSHDLTHGVALSLVMLACLWKASHSASAWYGGAAGFALGLVLLTKAEVALAATLSASAALGMMLLSNSGAPRSARTRVLLLFILAALLPPLIAVVLLWRLMPLTQALLGCAGAWVWIFDRRIHDLPFFRDVLGTDEPEQNILRSLAWLVRYAIVLIPALGIGLMMRRCRGGFAKCVTIAVSVALVGALMVTWNRIPWAGVIRPLPLVLMLSVLVQAARWLGTRKTTPAQVLLVGLSVFSLTLLAKIVFNVRPFHYGFALAMPGTLLLIVLVVFELPRFVERCGGFQWFPRAIALLAAVIGSHVRVSRTVLATRGYAIGSGADRFLVDGRGPVIEAALQELNQRIGPGDTLLVIPEGAMLNFLLRVPSRIRWHNFLPSEMMMYGQQRMLKELKAHPPTFVAIVNRDASEYGAQHFAEDYGHDIAAWLREHYEPIALFGDAPLRDGGFGILVLKLRSTDID